MADDNRVPGITPDLVATTGGALIAWSRYHLGDGYRVHLSRFDGRAGPSRP